MNRTAALAARRAARKREGARAILVTFAMAAALAGPLALHLGGPLRDARPRACALDFRVVFGSGWAP